MNLVRTSRRTLTAILLTGVISLPNIGSAQMPRPAGGINPPRIGVQYPNGRFNQFRFDPGHQGQPYPYGKPHLNYDLPKGTQSRLGIPHMIPLWPNLPNTIGGPTLPFFSINPQLFGFPTSPYKKTLYQ